MEAVGAGASVLTFITVAVGTAKLVYETLNSVKDGPRNVKKTADTILQVHSTLEQLLPLCQTTGSDGLYNDTKSCIADLDSFAAKVVKLQVLAGERRNGRLWKRLKAFVSEKELDEAKETMSRHCARLNLRLSAGIRYAKFLHSHEGWRVLISITAG